MSLCNIKNEGKLLFGHGGSNTIIILKDNNIYKFFPIIKNELYLNYEKKQKNTIVNEINILKKLRKDFVDKNKTPHIVKILGYNYCEKIPKDFYKGCKVFKDRLNALKNDENDSKDDYQERQCWEIAHHYNSLYKGYYITQLEYCPVSLDDVIKNIFKDYTQRESKYYGDLKYVKTLFDRILFQIFFTLEVIKKEYPYFKHSDLFLRNVLGIVKNSEENKGKVIRYNFSKMKFDLPYNGLYVKINDFGHSIIDKKVYKKKEEIVIDNRVQDWFDILSDIIKRLSRNITKRRSVLTEGGILTTIKKWFANVKDDIKLLDSLEEFMEQYFSNFLDYKSFHKIVEEYIIITGYPSDELFDKAVRDYLKIKSPREVFRYFQEVFQASPNNIVIEEINKG
jgi:hypothetical protein